MKSKSLLIIFILAIDVLVFSGCAGAPGKFARTREQMGTFVTITLYSSSGRRADAAIDAAFAEIEHVESVMSSYRKDSELNKLNAAGADGFAASDELFEIIEKSLEISELTEGAFDITVGPLVAEWLIAKNENRAPDAVALAEAEKRVGYKKVMLDHKTKTVRFAEPGMRIDLGAVAKGYAVDRAMEALMGKGIESALVDAGGDVLAKGKKPDGRLWTIGIQDPRAKSLESTILNVENMSVTTSGDYQRYIESGGRRYSHIFDPRTGKSSDCVSATTIAPTAMRADALSTAFCVLGPEKGIEVAESLNGIEAFIIDVDGKTYSTTGFSIFVVPEE